MNLDFPRVPEPTKPIRGVINQYIVDFIPSGCYAKLPPISIESSNIFVNQEIYNDIVKWAMEN
jgi:chromosome condensin MukBEF MukE localization factor